MDNKNLIITWILAGTAVIIACMVLVKVVFMPPPAAQLEAPIPGTPAVAPPLEAGPAPGTLSPGAGGQIPQPGGMAPAGGPSLPGGKGR